MVNFWQSVGVALLFYLIIGLVQLFALWVARDNDPISGRVVLTCLTLWPVMWWFVLWENSQGAMGTALKDKKLFIKTFETAWIMARLFTGLPPVQNLHTLEKK